MQTVFYVVVVVVVVEEERGLTEVSPLLRESFSRTQSLQFISSLMNELKLTQNDLQTLVLLFKPSVTTQR
ncbi:hypothetical protein DNTS_007087 [Danionella cerebrum]|uniref:Uncharacterized protein n=1 Tax=Danionella cerebrum TaxID=2873325 RepID=A0A553QC86_9TELE|nr:hypothetical protein DNTS_007087 [Danionella translucida]